MSRIILFNVLCFYYICNYMSYLKIKYKVFMIDREIAAILTGIINVTISIT